MIVLPFAALFMSARFLAPGDNGWRDESEVESSYPPGPEPHHVLLDNSGTSPLFVEIRTAAWREPRFELVLPQQRQWVAVPTSESGDGKLQLDATPLDMPAAEHFVFDGPEEWNCTFVTIWEDARPSVRNKPRGDMWPNRNLVGVTTEYRYPVRVGLPYDGHERPVGKHVERKAWVGPGTGTDWAGCATAIRRGVQILCAVPRPAAPALQIDEPVTSDSTTRIVLRRNGQITRDGIPLSRRVQHWGGF